MHSLVRRSARGALLVLVTCVLGACSSIPSGRSLLQSVRPYQMTVVQGNFVSREQVQALQAGMGRQQVRDLLGTPLVTSVFHADRWDYVFTLQQPGQQTQTRRLTVFFQGDVLARHEGDEMPSEADFVASLSLAKTQNKKVPVLEATEEQLARYPQPSRAAEVVPSTETPATVRSYPPLDAAVQ